MISLNNGLDSDGELYSEDEENKSLEVSMRCDTQEESVHNFDVPMTPVPSKKRKPVLETVTSPTEMNEYLEEEVDKSTPRRSLPRKRRPAVEPELNVRGDKGYTSYAAHLFDVPPACLNIDLLRRKYLIAEVSKIRAEETFFNRWVTFMNFITESARKVAVENGIKLNDKDDTADADDHDYCMSQPSKVLVNSAQRCQSKL